MLNVSTLDALVTTAYVLIALYLLRTLAYFLIERGSVAGEGLGYITG